MKNNNKKTTKRSVAISFFFFMIIFLMFLTILPGFYNIEYFSTPMIIGKFLSGFLSLLFVAYNGASFIYKLLDYFESDKYKDGDL